MKLEEYIKYGDQDSHTSNAVTYVLATILALVFAGLLSIDPTITAKTTVITITTLVIYLLATVFSLKTQSDNRVNGENMWAGIRLFTLPIMGIVITFLTISQHTFNTTAIIITLIAITELIYFTVTTNKPQNKEKLFWHVAKQKLLSLWLAIPTTFTGWFIIDHADNIYKSGKIIPFLGKCAILIGITMKWLAIIITIIALIVLVIYTYIKLNTLKYRKEIRKQEAEKRLEEAKRQERNKKTKERRLKARKLAKKGKTTKKVKK